VRGMPAVEATTLSWQKSSFCNPSECLEVARHEDRVLIRDSANTSGPALDVHRDRWHAFISSVISESSCCYFPSHEQ